MTPEEENDIIQKFTTHVADASIVANPLVSVLMWSYNDLAFIRQSIDSVLMQKTNFDFELVISGDCATDGTTEILHEYQRLHPNIIRLVLSTENLWTRNVIMQRLLYQGRGKYIALTHGDDYWTDTLKLQRQVDYLEANPQHSGVFHDTVRFENGDDFVLRREYDRVEFTLEDTISIMPICHTASLLFRREIVDKLPRWLSRVISGDMALYALVAANGGLHRVPMVMSAKRNHPGGISSTNSHRGIRLHSNRLYMHLCIRAHLNGRCRRESNRVIAYHADGVFCGTWSVAESYRRIIRVFRLEPWLLFYPSSSFHLLQALIRIHFRKNAGDLC